MYIVIHSKDPYLLARMATDLQMGGFKNDKYDNVFWNPFGFCGDTHYDYKDQQDHLTILSQDKNKIRFYNHKINGVTNELTERNYLTTLSFILKNKDK